jgi:Bacteriophage tail sheath protein
MFPQVITRVVDNSQITTPTSRFRAGLVGVAQRGAFDEVTNVPSIFEFVRLFGAPIEGSFLGDAVSLISQSSDGCRVVRVGQRYSAVANNNASGSVGAYALTTPNASLFSPGDHILIRQPSKVTTPNAKVDTIVGSTVNLVAVGSEAVALADTYAGATISAADSANAANEAEAFLTAPTYGTVISGLGTVIGDKNAFKINVSGTYGNIAVDDVLKISQTNRETTREIKVSEVRANGDILFYTSNQTNIGYQALGLQDSYTGATINKVTAQSTALAMQVFASSPGTWANTQGQATGITLQVQPGSAPDTKKFLVYQGSVLVETIDNLSNDPDSDDYYETRINGNSSYISIYYTFGTEPPGNTYNPWNTAIASASNIAEFSGGFNGENVTDQDYIGTIDPNDDTPTGLKLFERADSDAVDVDFIAVPDSTSIAVYQEIARIAAKVNAIGIGNIPDNLSARNAIDWHNGTGLYTANGRIDNYRMAFFWNWFQISDTFTGVQKFVPPALGYLRCAARTFDQDKPWRAVAGDIRGVIPEAQKVRYKYVSMDVKNAMYGNGNSVNPVLLIGNSVEIYGERTLQRTESKLTALHNVVLVNYILKGFSAIARRYTFDPIDDILFQQLRLDYTNFMEAVKSERGVEGYSLQLDKTNNTPATRNARQVIVDLAIIPIDVAEVFIITAAVEKSGATLTNIGTTNLPQ